MFKAHGDLLMEEICEHSKQPFSFSYTAKCLFCKIFMTGHVSVKASLTEVIKIAIAITPRQRY